MKRYLLLLVLLIATMGVFAQATPTSDLRVANATTAMGSNLPIGTKVYNVATGQYYVVTTAAPSAATLAVPSTGAFTLLNAPQVLGIGGTTTGTITLTNGSGTATIAGAGINTVGQSGGTITITGTEIDGSISNEGSLSVAAGTATTSVINSNTSGSTGVTLSVSGTDGLGLSEAGNTITLSNSKPDQTVTFANGGITTVTGTYPAFTITSTEVDGSLSNEGQLTTVGTANNATIHSNTSGSTDLNVKGDGTYCTVTSSGANITVTGVSQIQNLSYTASPTNGLVNISSGTGATLPVADGTNAGLMKPADFTKLSGLATGATATTFKVESFVEGTTGATGQTNTLAQTPKGATGVLVSLNGTELPAAQCVFATNTVKVNIPVYQYDVVIVTYTY